MKILGQTAAGEVLEITVDADGHLQIDVLAITAGSNLIGRVDARDGDKIFSFAGVQSEFAQDIDLGSGNQNVNGATVPAGEIWCITTIAFFMESDTIDQTRLMALVGGNNAFLDVNTSPTTQKWNLILPEIYLEEGDRIYLRLYTCSEGDAGKLAYAGYKMQI